MKKFSKYLFVIGAVIVAMSSVPVFILAVSLFTMWAVISSIITCATIAELMALFVFECRRQFKKMIKEIKNVITD